MMMYLIIALAAWYVVTTTLFSPIITLCTNSGFYRFF